MSEKPKQTLSLKQDHMTVAEAAKALKTDKQTIIDMMEREELAYHQDDMTTRTPRRTTVMELKQKWRGRIVLPKERSEHE
jgi:hypothetical protein